MASEARDQWRHAIIIGGGITGLTVAHLLQRAHHTLRVTLLESDDRLGGKIRTEVVAGVRVDVGPDAIVAGPSAMRLCESLGLRDRLVSPAASTALIWVRGRLRPIPQGLMQGIPTRIGPVVRSGVLSPLGMLRAGFDLVLPRTPVGDDMAVGTYVGRRLGRQVVDRLVDPLLGGIYAGSADELGIRSAAPDLYGIARRHRSLIAGLRALRRASAQSLGPRPGLVTLDGGLGVVVERLTESLSAADVRQRTAALRIEPRGQHWRVHTAAESLDADVVIIATPAFAAADLLRTVSPEATETLYEIPYASVATVTLAYPKGVGAIDSGISGFLVPRSEGRTITACTVLSNKWLHLAPPDVALIRCSIGRRHQSEALHLDDDALVRRVHHDLRDALRITAEPITARVVRWPQALPQYVAGHQQRIWDIERALPEGLVLAGAAYEGVGLATCIAHAERVATEVVGNLGVRAAEAIGQTA